MTACKHKYICGILLLLFAFGFSYGPPSEPKVDFGPVNLNSGYQTIWITPMGDPEDAVNWDIRINGNRFGTTNRPISEIHTPVEIIVTDNTTYNIQTTWKDFIGQNALLSPVKQVRVLDRTPPSFNSYHIDGMPNNIAPGAKIRIDWSDKDINGDGVSWNISEVRINNVPISAPLAERYKNPPSGIDVNGYAYFYPSNQKYNSTINVSVLLKDHQGNFMTTPREFSYAV